MWTAVGVPTMQKKHSRWSIALLLNITWLKTFRAHSPSKCLLDNSSAPQRPLCWQAAARASHCRPPERCLLTYFPVTPTCCRQYCKHGCLAPWWELLAGRWPPASRSRQDMLRKAVLFSGAKQQFQQFLPIGSSRTFACKSARGVNGNCTKSTSRLAALQSWHSFCSSSHTANTATSKPCINCHPAALLGHSFAKAVSRSI